MRGVFSRYFVLP
jgi:hypothetical protein